MPNSSKRQRHARVACEPCRNRKRKCNGRQPCATCSEYDYTCYYDVGSRKKRNRNHVIKETASTQAPQTRQETSKHSPSPACSSETLPAHPMESNSGAAFVRELALKLDPLNAPEPKVFAWNIGRQMPSNFVPLPIVNIISETEMRTLAHVYFQKVHPYYGFLDHETVYKELDHRWLLSSAFEPYDVVLCGVAAMGYLFSHRRAVAAELHLVESARSALEQSSTSGLPSLTMIMGWTLRLAYLRHTASPHGAWMASCSLLHLIEASGIHLDPSSRPVLIRPPRNIDEGIRRRLVGFAQYLNTWISFDLGRSRVIIADASYMTLTSPEGSYTAEMLNLLPQSENLDPHRAADPTQLTTMLNDIIERVHTQAPSVLSQCNIVLCLFRRLRAIHSSIPSDLMCRLLQLIAKSLACSRDLANANCPWAYVANVPFQIICLLLAVDNRESLSILGDAVRTLKLVTDIYDTDTMKEAYRTAGMLIRLQQKRKNSEAKHLSDVLESNFTCPMGPEQELTVDWPQKVGSLGSLRDIMVTPSFEPFDFNELLNLDNPGFALGLVP
ncbi:hypothetical protein BDV25DRAFT_158501 [Aspergillus avenaceus]|uniref:Zn(2)-C6 fungal-type domain-containing protein n=1 Tax=Aspergillus avenaceus TaxID=36643 RepID=A0A5N6TQE6_ASPAV|nr:hypothetical protein BDV25DRAFT_158501 [Aspergillus avenaceus]